MFKESVSGNSNSNNNILNLNMLNTNTNFRSNTIYSQSLIMSNVMSSKQSVIEEETDIFKLKENRSEK